VGIGQQVQLTLISSARPGTASEDSRRPVLVGNSRSAELPGCSPSQVRITAATFAVSGVTRSLRPLPWQRTVGPVPAWTSPWVRPVTSLGLSPVWAVPHVEQPKPGSDALSGAMNRIHVKP
jgi:hypothetical protein